MEDMRFEASRGAKQPLPEPGEQVAEYYEPAFAALVQGSAGVPKAAAFNELYSEVPKPGRGDWLAEHEERGQPMRSFQRGQFRARPHGSFNTIVIVILGEGVPFLKELEKYTRTFFQCNVIIRGPYKLAEIPNLRTRIGSLGQQQMFTKECQDFVLSVVKSDRELSRVAVGVIGITMEDLTPSEEYNFVYGIASLTEGSGLFSLARFSPAFNGQSLPEDQANRIVFQRACKVVSHELGHIFGLLHCVNYCCLMNGANHVGELERQPLLECPVCTKKLTSSFGWDVLRRYQQLAQVYAEFGFEEEANRMAAVLKTAEAAMKECNTAPPKSLGRVYTM